MTETTCPWRPKDAVEGALYVWLNEDQEHYHFGMVRDGTLHLYFTLHSDLVTDLFGDPVLAYLEDLPPGMAHAHRLFGLLCGAPLSAMEWEAIMESQQ